MIIVYLYGSSVCAIRALSLDGVWVEFDGFTISSKHIYTMRALVNFTPISEGYMFRRSMKLRYGWLMIRRSNYSLVAICLLIILFIIIILEPLEHGTISVIFVWQSI